MKLRQNPSTLGDVAAIVMGQSPPGHTVSPSNGIPLLNGPTEFGQHHPTPVQFTNDSRKFAEAGDILFFVRGSTTGRMNWADQDYAIGRGVAAIRHKELPELQPFVRGAIELALADLLASATGSTFPNVSADQLAAISYPDMELQEQRAIAHVLGTLDDKIELNRRMNETLEAMAQALFTSWFVDFEPIRAKMDGRWRRGESLPGLPAEHFDLFPDTLAPSQLGPIPEGWQVKPLGDMVAFQDNLRVPLNSRERAARQGPYPYYGAAGVMDHVDDYLFGGIFVLVGEDGTVMTDEGLASPQYVWGQFWVNNHAHVLKGTNGISEEHLYVALQHVNIAPFVTGAVQPKVSQTNLKQVPLMAPSQAASDLFASTVCPYFDQLRLNTEESRALAAQRDALLPRLVSGEVGVVK